MNTSAPDIPAAPDAASRLPLATDVAVGVLCFILLMATSPFLPLVWDEPNAMLRAGTFGELRLWFHRTPSQPPPWSSESIRALCPYTTVIEGHPAFYGFVIAVGHMLTATWLPSGESYRVGPMLLFAVAVGAFFRRLRQNYGATPALFGVATLLTMPRVFAHAHFASIDGPLTACWLLAWASFGWACRSRVGCVVWGVLLGLTMSCKFTGWLAPFGFVAWSVLYRDRAALRTCAAGSLVAMLAFVDLIPPLWNDPLDGLWQFFSLNMNRATNRT